MPNDNPTPAPTNGEAHPASPWPFDRPGVDETVGRATERFWQKEEERRESGGARLHLYGVVVTILLQDEEGHLAVGMGLDYPDAPGGDPTPLIGVVGRHLAGMADEAIAAKKRTAGEHSLS